MALGVTMQLPIDDKHSYNKDYLLSQLAILMGGRIAEEKFMHHMTTGAGMISGPMPSPWATVMGVFLDIREPPGYWNAPHRATTVRGHLLQPRLLEPPANPGQSTNFRRTLPETWGLSQGLPR